MANYLPEPAYGLARTVYGELGLSTEDLMRPSTYSRARGLSRWPDRMSAGRTKAAACKDGIGTTMARSLAAKCGQEDYALRVELGQRAYAALTGKSVRRTPSAKPAPKRTRADDVRERIQTTTDGREVVVLSAEDLASVLRQKAGTIRMADYD